MPTLSLTPTPERQSPIRQESLTVLARVDREAPGASAPSVFADPELGIHFARLVVIPKDGDQADSSVWLAFESNFDTPFSGEVEAQAAHLDALSARARDTLAEIFGRCSGFPAAGSPETAGRLAAHLQAGQPPP